MSTTVAVNEITKPLFDYIAEAMDHTQLNFIYKRIQNTKGISDEERNALDEAWRLRSCALNAETKPNHKPRWKTATML
ncbi:MAG TPA: hypothetical protein VN516_00090 [Candidatus Baltobacteraceae bacterium]|nr:hypothetical protein [Candidatus Baltobacteraceae bacterium]